MNEEWKSDFIKRFSIINANLKKPVIGRPLFGKKAGEDYIEHVPTKEVMDYIEELLNK